MKTYRITVNGIAYDVQVEETVGGVAPAPVAAPVAPAAPAAPAPAAAPAAPAPAAAPAGAAGSVEVTCQSAGKVLETKLTAGTAVKRGDVIMVLESMKMEIDIVAPQDGTIASINVTNGQPVELGTVLATLN